MRTYIAYIRFVTGVKVCHTVTKPWALLEYESGFDRPIGLPNRAKHRSASLFDTARHFGLC